MTHCVVRCSWPQVEGEIWHVELLPETCTCLLMIHQGAAPVRNFVVLPNHFGHSLLLQCLNVGSNWQCEEVWDSEFQKRTGRQADRMSEQLSAIWESALNEAVKSVSKKVSKTWIYVARQRQKSPKCAAYITFSTLKNVFSNLPKTREKQSRCEQDHADIQVVSSTLSGCRQTKPDIRMNCDLWTNSVDANSDAAKTSSLYRVTTLQTLWNSLTMCGKQHRILTHKVLTGCY